MRFGLTHPLRDLHYWRLVPREERKTLVKALVRLSKRFSGRDRAALRRTAKLLSAKPTEPEEALERLRSWQKLDVDVRYWARRCMSKWALTHDLANAEFAARIYLHGCDVRLIPGDARRSDGFRGQYGWQFIDFVNLWTHACPVPGCPQRAAQWQVVCLPHREQVPASWLSFYNEKPTAGRLKKLIKNCFGKAMK